MDNKFMQNYLIQLLLSQQPAETPNLPANYKKLYGLVEQLKQAFGANIDVKVAAYEITRPAAETSDSNALNEDVLLQSFDNDQFKTVQHFFSQHGESWSVRQLTPSEYFTLLRENNNNLILSQVSHKEGTKPAAPTTSAAKNNNNLSLLQQSLQEPAVAAGEGEMVGYIQDDLNLWMFGKY